MKIDVWVDILCPFCYIGKRKLEAALKDFDAKEVIEITYKSFLLAPNLKTQENKNVNDYLMQEKQVSLEQAKEMNAQVSAFAAQNNIDFQLDRSVLANSIQAHCLLQFSARNNKQNEVVEALFAAYFTEGKNIDSVETLKNIAAELEIDFEAFLSEMQRGSLLESVKNDLQESARIGITGVPFYIFNNSQSISGAQAKESFLAALRKAS